MGLSHMLCIGYGVYPPSTTEEVWATIFSMSIGASLFACIVGSITAVLLSLDSTSANFQTYMNEANLFCSPASAIRVTQEGEKLSLNEVEPATWRADAVY